MAVATTQFVISPDDGWVEIASNPASLIIKPDEGSSWRLAVTTGAAPSGGAQASGHVDFTGVPANNGTVTIAGVVYTFKTALTPAANEVFRGVDAAAMAANLAAAVNAGVGAGTLYGTGTVANPSVFASAAAGVVTITAEVPGVAGNSIALVDGATNMTVSGAVLTAGVDYVAGCLLQSGRDGDPLTVNLGGFTGTAWIRAQQTTAHFNVMQDVGPGSGGSVAANSTIVGPLGRQADAASVSVALSTEDVALLSPVALTGGAFALTGVSQTLVAAAAGKNKIFLYNPIGNGTVTVDLAGAAVVAGAGYPLLGGGTLILEPGITNALTGIGTNGQTLYVWKG